MGKRNGESWGRQIFLWTETMQELSKAVGVSGQWSHFVRHSRELRAVHYWWIPDSTFIDPWAQNLGNQSLSQLPKLFARYRDDTCSWQKIFKVPLLRIGQSQWGGARGVLSRICSYVLVCFSFLVPWFRVFGKTRTCVLGHARAHLYDRSLLLCGGWLLTSGMLERTEWLGVSKTVWFDPTVHELPEWPATAWTLGWNKLVGSQSRYVEMISLHISRGIALFVGQPAMLTRLPPCCCSLLWITLWNRVWHTHLAFMAIRLQGRKWCEMTGPGRR